MILVYDALRLKTYTMFIYKSMKWNNIVTQRKSTIGYFSMFSDIIHSFNNAHSMTRSSFRMHNKLGNCG